MKAILALVLAIALAATVHADTITAASYESYGLKVTLQDGRVLTVPESTDNRHYKLVLAWVDAGNTITPRYRVVAFDTGTNVVKDHGFSASTSTNPTAYTTSGSTSIHWSPNGTVPTDVKTGFGVYRYSYSVAGSWAARSSGDVTADDGVVQDKKKTPINESCSSFTLPAGQTALRINAPQVLPDATFCILMTITSGTQTGFWRASSRDTSGVTVTFTQNTNEIQGVVMFHDGMH